MPYALRSIVNSADLEVAEILMSLAKPNVHDDSDSEYIPDDDSVVESEYTEDDDATAVDDQDYIPEDNDDDEDYVPEEDDDDDVPQARKDTTENLKTAIRLACSSIAKGTEIPREFWRVLALVRKNRTPVSFKRWMLGIPPVKSIYLSFAKRG